MGVNWPALMRAGLRDLRLTPQAFWALTPAELGLLLGQDGTVRALDRAGLNALMTAYPDAPPRGAASRGRHADIQGEGIA